jgi:hypothetical protein
MVIAARSPLDRQYAALLFQDVFGEKAFIPLAHAANIPHRVMAFDVVGAERRWYDTNHPLYDFVIATHHADIDLNSAPALNWPQISDGSGNRVKRLAAPASSSASGVHS